MDNQRLKHLLIGEELTLGRFFRSIIYILTLTIMGILSYAYLFADNIAFQPRPSSYKDDSNTLKLSLPDGSQISAVYLPNPAATYTILYSHGNAEDLGHASYTFEALRKMGFSVFGYDYRGYGTSTGKPSERNAYEDIETAYNYLTQTLKIPSDKIIAYGRSLGGAIAINLASQKPLAGLIVESTFVSGIRVLIKYWLVPFDVFNSKSKIKKVKCPVLVIHGTKDEVIELWHGQQLYENANEPKMSLWIENAGHNDLAMVAGNRLEKTLNHFIELVNKTQLQSYQFI
jgi:abhydrolase domain-containing protein 17